MKLQNKSLKDYHAAYSPWGERLFLCVAVLLAYASVWPNGFVFDDIPLITRNELLKNWSGLAELLTTVKQEDGLIAGFYRPVQLTIYFILYQAFGLSAVAFHGLNVVLHMLNACLLHRFGRKAGFTNGVAFAAALVWAVHPLHTINVAYVASTAELLWGFFCLLGLTALLPGFTTRNILLSMLCFVLALGSKESAAVFPALAVVTFFLVNNEQRTHIFKTWPLWLMSLGYIAVWFWFINTHGSNMERSPDPQWVELYTGNFANRLLTSLSTLPVYAGLIVWPTGLHLERVYPTFLTLWLWQPLTGAFMAALGLMQIIWGRMKRGLALGFGILWFAIALAPYSGIVLPIDALISEGWMYVPTMGLFLGVFQTVSMVFEKRKMAVQAIVAAVALSLGVATFIQNQVWRDTETLYQNILNKGGNVDRLSPLLAQSYMEQEQFDKAASQLRYTIDHPAEYSKTFLAEKHLQLAMALLHVAPDKGGGTFTFDIHAPSFNRPNIPTAIAALGKAVQLNPDFYWAHAVLAILYRDQGNSQMAGFHERKVQDILERQK